MTYVYPPLQLSSLVIGIEEASHGIPDVLIESNAVDSFSEVHRSLY